MLRKVAAVIAGIIAAVGIFMAFEYLNGRLYPAPPGLDAADHKGMSDYVESLPSNALWVVLTSWGTGSFICGIIVRLISKSSDRTPAYLAGLFLMAAGIVDIFLLPHPLWFIVIGVLIFIPVTLAGHALIKRKS